MHDACTQGRGRGGRDPGCLQILQACPQSPCQTFLGISLLCSISKVLQQLVFVNIIVFLRLGVYYNAMILELCVTHLTMCVWVQMMHFGCRTYIPIFEFTPSYLQNSINSDSAILSCRRCTYKRIPALAVEQNNCAVLFYTGRYYLALNTAFLCLYTSASIKNRGYIVQFRHYCQNRPVLRRHQY